MGERVLPTVQALSEMAKTRVERERETAKCFLETRTPKSKNMIREVRQEGGGAAHRECGCSSLRVRVQLTESAGMDVDDEFS